MFFDRLGQRPAGVGAGGFLWNLGEKTYINLERGQVSAENHRKIMHTTAKRYFAVVCTHLEASRAISVRFSMIFHGFSRFWVPRLAQLAPSRSRPAEQLPSSGPACPEPPQASRAAAEQSQREDFGDFI